MSNKSAPHLRQKSYSTTLNMVNFYGFGADVAHQIRPKLHFKSCSSSIWYIFCTAVKNMYKKVNKGADTKMHIGLVGN